MEGGGGGRGFTLLPPQLTSLLVYFILHLFLFIALALLTKWLLLLALLDCLVGCGL